MFQMLVQIPRGKFAILGVVRRIEKHWANLLLCTQNGWTDRDAVWGADSGGPKEACFRWGSDPKKNGKFLRSSASLKSIERLCCGVYAKTAEPMEMSFEGWLADVGPRNYVLHGGQCWTNSFAAAISDMLVILAHGWALQKWRNRLRCRSGSWLWLVWAQLDWVEVGRIHSLPWVK